MNKNTKYFSFANVGLSSLLVVFLVLCLTTFALLSLSSARSDYSLSEKLAAHRFDYYDASGKAEEIIAQIDTLCEYNYKNNRNSYMTSLSGDIQSLSTGTDITITAGNSYQDMYIGEISFCIPLDERQSLNVTLGITNPSNNKNYYEIIEWQVKTVLQQEIDNTLNLLPVN